MSDENEMDGTRPGVSETKWPGDPSTVWEQTTKGRVSRPRDVPWPESVDEIAKWEDPDGFGRTELYHAPIFWVCLPVVALGGLIYGMVTNPGGIGWSGDIFDETLRGGPWNFWLVWVGVILWLLIAIGVLLFRTRVIVPEIRKDNEWIYEHGIPCSIHRAPFDWSDGDGGETPTWIAIDHRVPRAQAGRMIGAFQAWLSQGDMQGNLEFGSQSGDHMIAFEDLFGEEAAGGYFVGRIPGIWRVDNAHQYHWVFITPPRPDQAGDSISNTGQTDAGPETQWRQRVSITTTTAGVSTEIVTWWRRASITTVPPEDKLLKFRARLRRQAERRGGQELVVLSKAYREPRDSEGADHDEED